MAQLDRNAAKVKVCVFNAYGAFSAYLEEDTFGVIIVVALAEKSVGSIYLSGKADIVSGFGIHKSLIGIDYRLELWQPVAVEFYLSAAVCTVINGVGQHMAADHSSFTRMELRLCRSAFIIGRVIKQSKRQKHKGERRLTQPHFTRRGKSRTEHRRDNGKGGQPANGQYVICRKYRRAKGSRRRRKLPHCRLHSKIPRRQNVSAVFRIKSSYR